MIPLEEKDFCVFVKIKKFKYFNFRQFRDTFRDLFLSPIQKNYTRPVEFVTRTSPKALQVQI